MLGAPTQRGSNLLDPLEGLDVELLGRQHQCGVPWGKQRKRETAAGLHESVWGFEHPLHAKKEGGKQRELSKLLQSCILRTYFKPNRLAKHGWLCLLGGVNKSAA